MSASESKYKKINVTYTESYVDSEGIKIPKYNTRQYVTSHTKRYHNCLYLLAGITGCARNLIDYLAQVMDKNNMIYSNSTARKSFINEMKRGSVEYKDDTVKKAFKELKDKNFLLPDAIGSYQVNPKYFMKNNDDKRAELIKVILDFDPNKVEENINVEFKDVSNTI